MATAASLTPAEPAPTNSPASVAPADAAASQEHAGIASLQGKWVAGVRLGTALLEGGNYEVACSTNTLGVCQGNSARHDLKDRAPLVVGIDGLWHATNGLRLGLSYWLIPYSGVRLDGSDDTIHLGNAHRLLGVVEGLVGLGGTSKLALRGQAGLGMLVVGGDLEDANDAFDTACRGSTTTVCNSDSGPHFGSSFGVQVGYVTGSKLRWRTDLAVERFTQPVSARRLQAGDGALSLKETASASRLILSVGLEL